jgi:metal-responsive CopG/Arc/MetJ family transcriptional regulator
MSVKFQITLPDDLAVALKRAAVREKVPLAQLIRETMKARLRERKSTAKGDPFASIDGIVDSEETDLSSRVDEILYG